MIESEIERNRKLGQRHFNTTSKRISQWSHSSGKWVGKEDTVMPKRKRPNSINDQENNKSQEIHNSKVWQKFSPWMNVLCAFTYLISGSLSGVWGHPAFHNYYHYNSFLFFYIRWHIHNPTLSQLFIYDLCLAGGVNRMRLIQSSLTQIQIMSHWATELLLVKSPGLNPQKLYSVSYQCYTHPYPPESWAENGPVAK